MFTYKRGLVDIDVQGGGLLDERGQGGRRVGQHSSIQDTSHRHSCYRVADPDLDRFFDVTVGSESGLKIKFFSQNLLTKVKLKY